MRTSLRRLRAIWIKELRHIVRDKRSLSLALFLPVMMLLLYGYALSLDVDHIPTLVYDQSDTEASRDLVKQFQASRYFDVLGYVRAYAPIERAIDRGSVLLGVVIPRDYGKQEGSGRVAPVQLLLDGSDSNTASIALGYAESVVNNYSLTLRADAQNRRAGQRGGTPIDLRLRVWYNSSLESKNYVVPGLIAVILQIISALLTSLTIARELEMGTLEQLLSTPLRPVEIVLGKMLAYSVVGAVDSVVAVLVGLFVFPVPLRGSMLLVAAGTGLFLFGVLFWGIFISAVSKTQLQAYQMGVLSSFLPAFLLSGFVYSIDTMPKVIQAVTIVVPARYVVTIMKGVFLKGVGLSILWKEYVFLAAFAVLIAWAATRKLNQKVA